MQPFAERIGRHLGRPVEAACAVRPPYSTITMALFAGLGAGIGSIVGGGPIGAGAGGGLGALFGALVNWLRLLPSELSVAMALVLETDRVDLLRLGLRNAPKATIRSMPYADVTGVDAREGLLEVRISLRTAGEVLELVGGRRGVGAAPAVIDELRRRIAP
jgi:hypothetical protein